MYCFVCDLAQWDSVSCSLDLVLRGQDWQYFCCFKLL